MYPFTGSILRQDQPQFLIEGSRPACSPFTEVIRITFLSQFSSHFSQSPVLKSPLDSQASITGTISVTYIKVQFLIHTQCQHSSFGMVPFHCFESLLRIPFPDKSFLKSTRDKRGCRTSGHDIRISAGTGSARKQVSIGIIFQQRSGKIIQYGRISQPPKCI